MISRVFIPDLKTPPAPAAGGVVVSVGGETMGTTWSVRAVAETEQAPAITVAVQAALEEVIRQMSPWAPDSEISAYNRAAPGSWTRISPQFDTVLRAALAVASQSEGAFDPTLGAVAELWGFGSAGPVTQPPSPDKVRDALEAAGWGQVRSEEGRVRQPGGVRLDFSGIAKGYAVDLVFERLMAMGLASVLVEIGGELRGTGVRPDGQPWWVDIEMPPHSSLRACRLALHEVAVATSGDYRRTLEHEGASYSHTLDPRTGRPVLHRLASVTVIADTAMTADAQATAIMVLGPEAGHAYAVRHHLAALLVYPQANEWCERMTLPLARMMA